MIEQYKEIALSGDQEAIDQSIAFFEDQKRRYGLTIEGHACLNVLRNPYQIDLFSELGEILKPV